MVGQGGLPGGGDPNDEKDLAKLYEIGFQAGGRGSAEALRQETGK